MAHSIIAVNQTGSPVTLKSLGSVVVPASGQLDLTLTETLSEIKRYQELKDRVSDDTILINNGVETFTKAESLHVLDPVYSIKGFTEGHVNGLGISNHVTNPNYQIDIAIGECRDSTDVHTIHITSVLTVDLTVSGEGGLDTGTEASDTWYAVLVIDDTTEGNSPKGLLSLSATSPTLPSGYDVFRRIGWIRNNPSGNIMEFFQSGSGNTRTVKFLETRPNLQVLNSGSATTWTSVDLSGLVPSTSCYVFLNVAFRTGASGAASNLLDLRKKGAVNQVIKISAGVVSSSNMHTYMDMTTDSSQNIEYRVSNSNNRSGIHVLGWCDDL
jgi:hypothetical protein